jgi:hypothetical protein
MDVRQEMATIVRQVIGELIHAPVQVLTLNTRSSSGEVIGRFRSGQTIYDYQIKGENVSYRPMGASVDQARGDGLRDRPFRAV